MAETRIAGGTPTYTITHEDGSAVTPQEMYDAFMSGPVILESIGDGSGLTETVLSMQYSGTPDNVIGCRVYTHKGSFTLGGK